MFIYTHNAEENLLEFLNRENRGNCIEWQAVLLKNPDPSPLENWRKSLADPSGNQAMPDKDPHTQREEIKILRKYIAPLPCCQHIEIFFCTDNDILLLGKDLMHHIPAAVVASLYMQLFPLQKSGPEDMFTFFDLHKDYDAFAQVCNQKMMIYAMDRIQRADREMEAATFPDHDTCVQKMIHTARQQRHWQMPRMVVADNDKFIRSRVNALFSDKFHISQVTDGHALYEFYIHNAPDIIIVSENLPGINGFEFTEKVVKHDAHAFVLLTSNKAFESSIRNALKVGAQGFILKPFSQSCIERHLKHFWQHWHIMRNRKWKEASFINPETITPKEEPEKILDSQA